MSEPVRDPAALLPLRPVIFEMLLILNEDDRHGYGLMKDVKERTAGRWILGPGTLYRTLNEMQDLGLIEPTDNASGDKQAERRRYYRITPFGRRVAAAEAERMAALVQVAKRGDLLSKRHG